MTQEGPPLPDELGQLVSATKYQLRFFRRTYRFIGLALVTIALSLSTPLSVLYQGAEAVRLTSSVSQFLATSLGSLPFEVGLAAAFFGGDAIASDFGSATGYFSLVLPVRRSVLLLGRFLGAFLVTAAVSFLYVGIVLATGAALYGTLPASTFLMVGLVLLLVAAFLAIAFFLSALFRRPVVSTIAAVLLLWLAFPVVTAFAEVAGIEPWFMPDYAGLSVTQSLVVQPHHSNIVIQSGNVTLTTHQFYPYVAEGAAILAAYLLIFLAASIVVYVYKQVTA